METLTQEGRRLSEEGGRGRSKVPTSQGVSWIVSSTQKLGERQGVDSLSELPDGARPCQSLDLGLLAPRTGREEIPVLSHLVCGHVL